MKKILLITAFVLIFGTYFIYKRFVGVPETPAVLPSNQVGPVQMQPETPIAAAPPTPSSTQTSPSNTTVTPPPTQITTAKYKDGTYIGTKADAIYGFIQVKAIISGGKITDVKFLDYPNDRSTSVAINSQAMPYLRSEAIQAQTAKVDIVSGATDSSLAFRKSLASALAQA